jgi:hypothetical protein
MQILAGRLELAVMLVLTAGVTAFSSDSKRVRFSGEVAHDHEFRRPIGHGLVFVLVPDNSYPGAISGWTITIAPEAKQDHTDCSDFAWVVMPPYRSYNSRYLSTTYGTTAKEAVGWSPRDFNFVLNCQDYQAEGAHVDIALWPYSYSKKQQDDALAMLGTSSQGRGKMWIDKSKIRQAALAVNGVNYGSIDWIQFHVEIQFP